MTYNEALLSRCGTIKRARGTYLYTEKGIRLTDMFQEGGRAILGWGNSAGKAMQVFKNVLNRGQTGSFPSGYEGRLAGALLKLLPASELRWYASLERLFAAADLYSAAEAGVHDLYNEAELYASGVQVWRPWFDINWYAESLGLGPPAAQNIKIFCPPLAWAGTGYIAAFPENSAFSPPPSDFLPPPYLAALTRSIYDLLAEIPKRSEKDWQLFDDILAPYFMRSGPYLLPKIDTKKYDGFVLHCLDCGLYISPEYSLPSIIPYGANIGDFTKLKNRPYKF